jgi:hypothetical protein
MRWGILLMLVTLASLSSGTLSLAGDGLHTLAFMEGRYAGSVSIEPTRDQLHPPVVRRLPTTVSVERTADGLTVHWLTASEGYATAVIGTIGPTTYRAPETFTSLDWECRPAAIPPFRTDLDAIIVRLLCFIPGQLQQPPTAQLDIGNLLDRDTRRVTDRLVFDLRHLSERDSGRVVRHYYGILLRRLD